MPIVEYQTGFEADPLQNQKYKQLAENTDEPEKKLSEINGEKMITPSIQIMICR